METKRAGAKIGYGKHLAKEPEPSKASIQELARPPIYDGLDFHTDGGETMQYMIQVGTRSIRTPGGGIMSMPIYITEEDAKTRVTHSHTAEDVSMIKLADMYMGRAAESAKPA